MQVGAIVPWNYPFHNVFNPLTAAVFAGNAIVIKVMVQMPHRLLASYKRCLSCPGTAVGTHAVCMHAAQFPYAPQGDMALPKVICWRVV